MPSSNTVTIAGVVTEIRSWDSGFTLATIRATPNHSYAFSPTGDAAPPIKCVGKALSALSLGDSTEVIGSIEAHSSYGDQLNVTSAKVIIPTSEKAIYSWLMSIKGVGSVVAGIACKTENLFLEIEKNSASVIERFILNGINKKKAEDIVFEISNRTKKDKASLWLRSMSFNSSQIREIIKRYSGGTECISKSIRNNPYGLLKIPGISFITADKVSLSLGVTVMDPSRIDAGLRFVLGEAASSFGHTCLPSDKLTNGTEKLLGVSKSCILPRMAKLSEYNSHYYKEDLCQCEEELANRIKNHANFAGNLDIVRTSINRTDLSPGQAEAVAMALWGQSRICILTGGPGTGKTYTVKAIVDAIRRDGRTVALMAPTGRAAAKLTETTGFAASTIHRGFAWSEGKLKRAISEDVLILDESSMIGIELANEMWALIPKTAKVILIGDADQLKSVSAGNVFSNLLQVPSIPSVTLKENFRQSSGSMIPDQAKAIIEGRMPVSGDPPTPFPEIRSEETPTQHCKRCGGDDFRILIRNDDSDALKAVSATCRMLVDKYGKGLDLQVITPTRSKGTINAKMLGELVGSIMNGHSEKVRGTQYRYGDRLMCTKNNYDIGIFNGDIWHVIGAAYDGPNRSMTLLRLRSSGDGAEIEIAPSDLNMFEQGWAITVHKSQGSQYKIAVVVIHDQHRHMLMNDKSLLYTAITRGKDLVVLIASGKALGSSVRGVAGIRYSNLARRIMEKTSTP